MRVYVLVEEVHYEGECLLGVFGSFIAASSSVTSRDLDWAPVQPTKEGSKERWVASDSSWDYVIHVYEVGP